MQNPNPTYNLDTPIGFGLNSWRENPMPSGLAFPSVDPASAQPDIQSWVSGLPFAKQPLNVIQSKISESPSIIELNGGKAQINPSQPYKYPKWLSLGTDGTDGTDVDSTQILDNYCNNLLAYVPNNDGDKTLNSISLDNCSLPILTTALPDDYTDPARFNHLTNNLEIFKQSTTDTTGTLTIRDVCPKLCQSFQCPTIPSIDLPTPSTDDKEPYVVSLFIFKNVTGPIKSLLEYYHIKAPKNVTSPIINLFTGIQKCPAPSSIILALDTTDPTTENFQKCLPSPTNSNNPLNIKSIVENNSIEDYNCKDIIYQALRNTSTIASPSKCSSYLQKNVAAECNPTIKTSIDDYNNICNQIHTELHGKKMSDSPWMQVGEIVSSGDKNDYGSIDPYVSKLGDCKPSNSPISFTRIDKDTNDEIEFFKPSRSHKRLFITKKEDENEYGCIRDDIMRVDESYIDLSCNTNTSYPIERSKYVMINYIIEHSNKFDDPKKRLNTSDRTKLVMMDEEELIRKASELGIKLDDLNEYTKPKLISTVKDIFDPTTQTFKGWNELETRYLNINTVNEDLPKLGVKKWDYVGCSLDFNNADTSKVFESCKDKYPGLCEYHKGKCDAMDPYIKQAFRLDCPETCKVQLSDLDEFEKKQYGDLSICSSRGRCKWSRDQDESNLLPVCNENSTRDYGDSDTCNSFRTIEVGGCSNDEMTTMCNQIRCESLRGCEYNKGNKGQCHMVDFHDKSITEDIMCANVGGFWDPINKKCMFKNKYDTTISEISCKSMGGNWLPEKIDSCIFNSNSWIPLEDPCGLPLTNDKCETITDDKLCRETNWCVYDPETKKCSSNNFTELSDNERDSYVIDGAKKYKIISMNPSCTKENEEKCKQRKMSPDALELTLGSMDNKSPVKHNLMKGDYINIKQEELGEVCNELLTGYSRILQVSGSDKIYIKGPSNIYSLAYNILTSDPNDYTLGKCLITDSYRLLAVDASKRKEQCELNDKASCTYVESHNSDIEPYCKSCSLIKDRNECIDDNKTSLCGWGEVEDVCNTMGNLKDCNDMYIEGCMWDHDREMCILNEMTDDDGNKLRKSEGCMKCGNLKHKNTCISIANCFWDRTGDKSICKACSENNTQDTCNNARLTGGSCQWSDKGINTGAGLCIAADLYPLIYEWIWYNRIFIISVIVCFWLLWKIPTSRVPFPAKIGVYIIKFILFFVTIPGLMVYPGIQRADGSVDDDGNVIRKYYRDPPMDPNDPGFTDFLHDGDDKGAIWPARIYDGKWDDIIMEDDSLRSIIDLKISPGSLDWTSLFWDLLRNWNKLVNSMNSTSSTTIGDTSIPNSSYVVFVVIVIVFILSVILGIFNSINKPHPYASYSLVILSIVGISILYYNRHTTIDPTTEFDGNELANPYPSSHLFHDLYSLPTDKETCPYGCIRQTGDNVYKKCKDNRSLLAFGVYSDWLNPDSTVELELPPLNKSNKKWEKHIGGYLCPPKNIPGRYPYSWFCKNTNETCNSGKHFITKSEDTKNDADEKCKSYFDNYGECLSYDNATLHKGELQLTVESPSPTTYNLQCEINIPDHKNDNCPFEDNISPLPYVDEFKQRHPINIWENAYNKLAGPTVNTSNDTEIDNWQNQERYEIINQNFYGGKYS